MLLLFLVVVTAPWVLGGSVVALIYAWFSQNHAHRYKLAVATAIAVFGGCGVSRMVATVSRC